MATEAPTEGLPREPLSEEHSFDELATGLAEGTLTRARALKLVGAALLGGVLSGALPGVAEAKKGRKKKRRRRRSPLLLSPPPASPPPVVSPPPPGENCSPSNCPEGCCADNLCHTNNPAACGTGGGRCVLCPSNAAGTVCLNGGCCPADKVCSVGATQTCCAASETCLETGCCAQVCAGTCCPSGCQCVKTTDGDDFCTANTEATICAGTENCDPMSADPCPADLVCVTNPAGGSGNACVCQNSDQCPAGTFCSLMVCRPPCGQTCP